MPPAQKLQSSRKSGQSCYTQWTGQRRQTVKKETRRHCSLEHAEEDGYCLTDACTAETALIAKENREEMNAFLTSLTDTQRRRLLMYARGLNYREIARRENVDHKKIIKSISQARKKCMGGAPKVPSRVRINEGPNLQDPCSL